jgi:serine/threonine protein kinase/Leucine-rich repeat (LRR) protein
MNPLPLMNDLRQRAEATFHAALELPPGDRDRYISDACKNDEDLQRHVRELLRAHEDAGEFLNSTGATSPEVEKELARLKPEQPGDRVGPYKLLQQIGEGGFGDVWMAEQEEPVRRRVALKIVKLGMDTKEVIARFEQERQALALMEHPNIARVLDAGATPTGRPYFVMELVRGIRITEFCDQNHLSTQQRLNLFIPICHAVQHAHQKGIIHRDLKPSNILVTLHDGEPVPKVIDFGVAKATQQRLTERTFFTHFQQMIGTPLYMSPEQAEMSGLDIDTRSDIYSLGVLLYELLTGRTPFSADELMRRGLEEIRRVIREEDPPRPSTALSTMERDALTDVAQHRGSEPPALIGLMRGDIDWIVMKCLEKDRSRRYETANEVAADLQRHMRLEPVVARPASRAYRLRRLIQRNRLAFSAAAVAAVAMIAGTGISIWQALRAERAAARANSTLADLRATVPAFVAQARGLVTQGRFDDAIDKLDYALQFRPEAQDALLFKADLLEAQLRLSEAGQAYRKVLEIAPINDRAKRHAALCEQLEQGQPSREKLAGLYQVMIEEQRSAAELLPIARQLGEAQSVLVSFWLAQLKNLPLPNDPPLEQRLVMRPDGLLKLDLTGSTISDLAPIAGMPLGSLILAQCRRITDLSPLRGMSLKELDLTNTEVSDVTPLQGMVSLESLLLNDSRIIDLSPLRGLRLERLGLWNQNISDLSPLAGMQLRSVAISAIAANDFTVFKDMPLESLTLDRTRVGNLGFLQGRPLKGLVLSGSSNARSLSVLNEIPTLKSVVLPWPIESVPEEELEAIDALRSHGTLEQLTGQFALAGVNPRTTFTAKSDFFLEWDELVAWRLAFTRQGGKVEVMPATGGGLKIRISGPKVHDLIALRGMRTLRGQPVRELILRRTAAADLTPIAGLPLTSLDLEYTKIENIEALRGMPLEWLRITDTKVSDLAPLAGMKTMRDLGVGGTKITSLAPVAGIPLTMLQINRLKLADLAPLRGAPLKHLFAFDTTIADMSVIAELPLETLHLGAAKLTDINQLAACKSLRFLWLSDTNISDIRPLADLKLEQLHLGHTRVRDLTPLARLPLRVLTIDRCPIDSLAVLRDIPTLEQLVVSKNTPGLRSLRSHPKIAYISTRWDTGMDRPAETADVFWAELENRKP